jgi:uncharacterized membrane protein
MLIKAWKAMRAGEILANPEKWKNRQALINALAAILSFGVLVTPLDIEPQDIILLAGALATILGLVNSYMTVATSEKVGLPNKEQ